jgi:formylglycine-generating enzyme required for sulfatase activity
MNRVSTIFIGACLSYFACSLAYAEKRVALVIGNASYEQGSLKNPINDAKLVSATLESLGFKVIQEYDLDEDGIERAVIRFGRELSSADSVGLFYYAGHGAQVNGENYLIPVGSNIEVQDDLYIKAVPVSDLLNIMERATNRVNILILDACRNNPYPASTRSGTRGLAKIDAPPETLIAYATMPGGVAADGDGANSPFTEALSQAMLVPGLRAEDVIREAAKSVNQSHPTQRPWLEGLLLNDFYFTPPNAEQLAQINGSSSSSGASGSTRSQDIQSTSETPTPDIGTEFSDCPKCPTMVVVPGGSFTMGSPLSELERDLDEGPQFQVSIKNVFAVGKYEVTWSEWDTCVKAGGCSSLGPDDMGGDQGWGKGNRPVIGVNWNDAQSYVKWLSKETGEHYRLLSESQWEYVARAGTTTPFYFGSRITTQQANFNGTDTYNGSSKGSFQNKTTEAGQYPPNAFGLYDMHGNVFEWTEDCWNDSYDSTPADGQTNTSGNCDRRVLRGGSWKRGPIYLRSAIRRWYTLINRGDHIGFRVTKSFE